MPQLSPIKFESIFKAAPDKPLDTSPNNQIGIKGPSRPMITTVDPTNRYSSGFPPYLLYAGIGAVALVTIILIVK